MNTYTAKMKHSADTIERLVVMQYNTFQTRNKFLRVFLAMAMLVYGVYMSGRQMITPYLCLFLGCILLAGLNVRPKSNAKKLIAQMGGRFPSSDYSFSDNSFTDGAGASPVPYSSLIKLIDDRAYLYLYISQQSAYMIDRSTFKGPEGLDGFKDFLAKKTGLKWSRGTSFWTFSIKDLRSSGGNHSGDDGPRLSDRH